MWQKCPICNGTGVVPSHGITSSSSTLCTVCKGAKIISEVTGLPPDNAAVTLKGISTGTSTAMWHNFVPSANPNVCVICGLSQVNHPVITNTASHTQIGISGMGVTNNDFID